MIGVKRRRSNDANASLHYEESRWEEGKLKYYCMAPAITTHVPPPTDCSLQNPGKFLHTKCYTILFVNQLHT
jgi:hypothetical protein